MAGMIAQNENGLKTTSRISWPLVNGIATLIEKGPPMMMQSSRSAERRS